MSMCTYIYMYYIYVCKQDLNVFILNCKHVSSFRDLSVQSEAFKNAIKFERIEIGDI